MPSPQARNPSWETGSLKHPWYLLLGQNGQRQDHSGRRRTSEGRRGRPGSQWQRVPEGRTPGRPGPGAGVWPPVPGLWEEAGWGPLPHGGRGTDPTATAGPGDAGAPGSCLAPCQGCPHSPTWCCCPRTPLATTLRVRGQAGIAARRWLTPKLCAEPDAADAPEWTGSPGGRCLARAPSPGPAVGTQQAPLDPVGGRGVGGQVRGTPLLGRSACSSAASPCSALPLQGTWGRLGGNTLRPHL